MEGVVAVSDPSQPWQVRTDMQPVRLFSDNHCYEGISEVGKLHLPRAGMYLAIDPQASEVGNCYRVQP